MKIYHGNRQINDELFTNVSVNSSVAYEHAVNFIKINEIAGNGIFIFIQYLLTIPNISIG